MTKTRVQLEVPQQRLHVANRPASANVGSVLAGDLVHVLGAQITCVADLLEQLENQL